MKYLECSAKVVSGIMELLSMSIANHIPTKGPDMADVEQLTEFLRLLRPKMIEVGVFDAWAHINQGRVDEAIQILNYIVSVREEFTYAKSVLAYCLFLKGDVSWHAWCDEVLTRNEPEVAVNLMKAIQNYDNFRNGMLGKEKMAEVEMKKGGESNTSNEEIKAEANSQETPYYALKI